MAHQQQLRDQMLLIMNLLTSPIVFLIPQKVSQLKKMATKYFFPDLYDLYSRQMEDEEICNRESLPIQLKHCREEKHNRFINEKENTIQNNAQDKPPAAVNNEYPETNHTESCHNGGRQSV